METENAGKPEKTNAHEREEGNGPLLPPLYILSLVTPISYSYAFTGNGHGRPPTWRESAHCNTNTTKPGLDKPPRTTFSSLSARERTAIREIFKIDASWKLLLSLDKSVYPLEVTRWVNDAKFSLLFRETFPHPEPNESSGRRYGDG